MPSETDLSRHIQNALFACGIWCERIQSGKVKVKGGWMQLASEGTPDLLIVAPVYGWLETKTETGKLSDAQKRWHRQAQRHGIPVAVVRSWSEAVDTVQMWCRDRRR